VAGFKIGANAYTYFVKGTKNKFKTLNKQEGAYSGQSAYDFNNSTQAQRRKVVDQHDESAHDVGAYESRRL
jgi:hypothetical protein